MTAIPKPPLPDPDRNPFGRNRTPKTGLEQQENDSHTGHMATGADTGAKPPRRNRRPADTRDILLSLTTELADRMESVIAYALPHTGVRTQQDFIRRAIAQACADLEDRYNDGDSWPAIPKPEPL
ncbi:hypothetical protein [Nocardia fluminea]|uniref:hypothetical protein n=1 Tax=Nocardia fluminea TaxID=134984 RepID=UPI0036573A1F